MKEQIKQIPTDIDADQFPISILVTTMLGKPYVRESQIIAPNINPNLSPMEAQKVALMQQQQILDQNMHIQTLPVTLQLRALVTEQQLKYLLDAEDPVDTEVYKPVGGWQLPNGLVVDSIVIEYQGKYFQTYEKYEQLFKNNDRVEQQKEEENGD